MSYFEDQEDCWFANNCKGNPEDYDPYDIDSWPKEMVKAGKSKKEREREAHREMLETRKLYEEKSKNPSPWALKEAQQ